MGTRYLLPNLMGKIQDHPHAYGDKQVNGACGTQIGGSSPRVWGQVYLLLTYRSNIRIIPTRMGTSTVDDILNAPEKDHPHAYGDKSPICSSVAG